MNISNKIPDKTEMETSVRWISILVVVDMICQFNLVDTSVVLIDLINRKIT